MRLKKRNAFSVRFLRLAEETDDSGGSEELAGPWRVSKLEGRGFGLFDLWQNPAADEPFAVLFEKSTAFKFAVALSAASREPLYRQPSQPTEGGKFPVLSSAGLVEGWTECFHARLVELAHMADFCARSPYALAAILQAADSATLRKAGELLLSESACRGDRDTYSVS